MYIYIYAPTPLGHTCGGGSVSFMGVVSVTPLTETLPLSFSVFCFENVLEAALQLRELPGVHV